MELNIFNQIKPTIAGYYEELLLGADLYRLNKLSEITGLIEEKYQLITGRELEALVMEWEPTSGGLVSTRIYYILNELYCYDETSECYLTLYDWLLKQVYDILQLDTRLDWNKGLEETVADWFENEFLEERCTLEDWGFLKFALFTRLGNQSDYMISDSEKKRLFEDLTEQLEQYLHSPLRSRYQLYQNFQKPLRLVSLKKGEAHDLIKGIQFELSFKKDHFDGMSDIQTALNALILNLEVVPQENEYPVWDYETILDVMLEFLVAWLEEYYQLSEDDIEHEQVQSLCWSLWKDYWIEMDREKGVSWVLDRLKSAQIKVG